MNRVLLLTGATGALGVPLLAEFLRLRRFERIVALTRSDASVLSGLLERESPGLDCRGLSTVQGELGDDAGPATLARLPGDIDCILHAAACTKFRAPAAQLERANVEGTRQLLAWAAECPRRPRFVHFSTTCVAGRRTGPIEEAPLPDDRGFVNDYERTKWQAEQLIATSPLRPEMVRLATVVGSERDGRLHRPGAFHTTLRWLQAGLLPVIPGDENTRLDFVPTEVVTGFVPRLLARPAEPGWIYHLSSGARGVPLAPLLEFAAGKFSARSAAWRNSQILPPVLATRATFEDFRATIVKSRDFLFNQVLESVDSFLPELFYPKRYATAHAESVAGGPLRLPPWQDWMGRVIDYALDSDFGRRDIAAPRA